MQATAGVSVVPSALEFKDCIIENKGLRLVGLFDNNNVLISGMKIRLDVLEFSKVEFDANNFYEKKFSRVDGPYGPMVISETRKVVENQLTSFAREAYYETGDCKTYFYYLRKYYQICTNPNF